MARLLTPSTTLLALLLVPFLTTCLFANTLAVKVQNRKTKHEAGFLSKLLEQYDAAAEAQEKELGSRFQAQQLKLNEQTTLATEANTKAALAKVAATEFEDFQKSLALLQKIRKTASGLEKVLGSVQKGGNGKGCGDISCGKNAVCTSTTVGAQCVCATGFIGDGVVCRTPGSYVAEQLLQDGQLGKSTKVADMQITAFYDEKDADKDDQHNIVRLALTYRDRGRGNRGYLMLGTAEASGVAWSVPERFSETQAWGAVAVGWAKTGKLAVTWRDGNIDGKSYVRTGMIDSSVARDRIAWDQKVGKKVSPDDLFKLRAENKKPVNAISLAEHGLSKEQLTALPLANDKLVTFFGDIDGTTPYGAAVLIDLAETQDDKEPAVLGKFRFAEAAVTKLAAARLSNGKFVLEFQADPMPDAGDPSKIIYRDATLAYGEYDDGALLFDPDNKPLEPTQSMDIWSRGISAVSDNNLFASYFSARLSKVFLNSVTIDTENRKMAEVAKMELPVKGMSKLVSSVSVPYTEGKDFKGKRKAVTAYYRAENEKVYVHSCDMDAGGLFSNCKEDIAVRNAVSELTTIGLGAGKILLVYVNQATGTPYFQQYGVF